MALINLYLHKQVSDGINKSLIKSTFYKSDYIHKIHSKLEYVETESQKIGHMLLPLSLLVVCITSSEQQSFTMFQKCYSLLFIILKQQQAKKIYSLDILFVNENTDECTCICIWKMTMVLIVLSIMNDWNSKSLKMKYSVKKFWFLTKYCNLIKKKRRQKLQQHRVTCNSRC